MPQPQRAGPQCPKCENVDTIKTRTLEDAVIVYCKACGHIIGCVGSTQPEPRRFKDS